MPGLHRRQVLQGSAAATALALLGTGCGDDDGSAASSTTTAADQHLLGAVFPRNEAFLLAGVANRLPFVVASADGAPLDRLDGAVTMRATHEHDDLGAIPTTVRAAGLARPFVAAEWTPPEPGFYEITATYRGRDLPPVALQAFDPAASPFPRVGQPFTLVHTPTTADPAGVDPICTADPRCPLHALDLATRPAGRPTGVLVATPAYCQTAICGPVLDLVVAAAPKHPGVDLIHVEVYADPLKVQTIAEATLSPAVSAWNLTYEPTLMLLDASGTLVRRLDLIFDRDELDEALAELV